MFVAKKLQSSIFGCVPLCHILIKTDWPVPTKYLNIRCSCRPLSPVPSSALALIIDLNKW